MTRLAIMLPLVWTACAGGPPLRLRLMPPQPVAEAAPGTTRYHVFVVAECQAAPPPGLTVDGVSFQGESLWLPRTVTAGDTSVAVEVCQEPARWRVVLPLVPGFETAPAAPDLALPLVGAARVVAAFHSATHALPGRRHAVDLVPEGADQRVLAPCAGVVVARTVDRRPGDADGNELHLRRGDGLVVVLSHLAEGSVLAAVGAPMVTGQPLARMGATGHATGPHLHLELRRHDGDTVPFRLLGQSPVAGLRLLPPAAAAAAPSGPGPHH